MREFRAEPEVSSLLQAVKVPPTEKVRFLGLGTHGTCREFLSVWSASSGHCLFQTRLSFFVSVCFVLISVNSVVHCVECKQNRSPNPPWPWSRISCGLPVAVSCPSPSASW